MVICCRASGTGRDHRLLLLVIYSMWTTMDVTMFVITWSHTLSCYCGLVLMVQLSGRTSGPPAGLMSSLHPQPASKEETNDNRRFQHGIPFPQPFHFLLSFFICIYRS
ncbi:hypothetical protein EDD16DRAFT_267297 [Pisolithus croceorrhizus]|nr:hypothetical protein EDD16DRAFT_267297 [Pisolithus croceorrhizus]KAI6154361.1 hypothetical protein EDD17DRAFT_1092052 [Pisolithus thermaeus]